MLANYFASKGYHDADSGPEHDEVVLVPENGRLEIKITGDLAGIRTAAHTGRGRSGRSRAPPGSGFDRDTAGAGCVIADQLGLAFQQVQECERGVNSIGSVPLGRTPAAITCGRGRRRPRCSHLSSSDIGHPHLYTCPLWRVGMCICVELTDAIHQRRTVHTNRTSRLRSRSR
jgi:hypothetical protein